MALNIHDLTKRTVFGAIYVLIMAVGVLVSWYTTVVLIAAIAALCCYEFCTMAERSGHHPYTIIATVAAGLIPLAMGYVIHEQHIVVAGLAIAFCAAIIMLIRFFLHDEDTIDDVALSVFGYLYMGLTMSAFIMVRSEAPDFQGGLLALIVLCATWGNDAFAYLGGSMFGKHKFSPRISPKKSIEGVIFGVVASILIWLLVPVLVPSCGFGFIWAALAGFLCGLAGVMGDLTESHIKRSFDVKDSGDIMPGHGGMFDRSDSLMFVSVVAYAMIAVAPYAFALFGFSL